MQGEHTDGLRDRAILLLIARLGLRAGDIVSLRLGDIDWHRASFVVWGKGRRETRLPLPQDAGDALLAYLEGARPRVACDRVFFMLNAPVRPINGHMSSAASSQCHSQGRDRHPDEGRQSAPAFRCDSHAAGGAPLSTWLAPFCGTALRT